MEPIKVMIVDQNDLLATLMASPILSFLLGSIFTYVMTIFTNNLGILGSKREKIIFIKESIDELLDGVDRIVVFLDPKTSYPPGFIEDDATYSNKEDYEKAFRRKLSQEIDSSFDRLYSLRKTLRPLISFYTSKDNSRYLLEIVEVATVLYREFVPHDFVFKRVYSSEVQSRIMHRIRNEYTWTSRRIVEAVLYAETKFFANANAKQKMKKQNLTPVSFRDFLEKVTKNSEEYETHRARPMNTEE